MFNIKPLLLLSLLCIPTVHYSQFTDVINSNRPGESMAAFSVGKTVIQAELGFYGLQEKHSILGYEVYGFGSDLQVRYGAFFEQMEFILDLQYQRENFYPDDLIPGHETHSGLKQTNIGVKYLIYDPMKNYQQKPNIYSWKANHKFNWRNFIPAVGVYAGVNVDMSGDVFKRPTYPDYDTKLSPRLMLLTQNQFGRFVVVTNIIGEKVGTGRESIDYVVTLTRGFNDRWSGLLEHQGFVSEFYADAIFRIGAAYLLAENIQVDASIGANIKDTPAILNGGIGLSWRFDDNYNEIMLRLPGEDKKDKKTKDEKKIEKAAKKRKDAVEEAPVQP